MAAMQTFDTSAGKRSSEDRFPLDYLLRQYGFTIASRAKGEPVMWRRGGNLFTQDLAERIVNLERRHRQQELKDLQDSTKSVSANVMKGGLGR